MAEDKAVTVSKKKFKKIIAALLPVCMSLALVFGVGAKQARTEEALSPGLFVIAERNGMARAGIRGRELSINREDFARALDVSLVSSITLTSVPDEKDGKLMLGNTVLRSGQTVNGSNLSLIKFLPASDSVTKASFVFSPHGEAYDITCTLYLLESVNYAPTLSMASAATLEADTYENVSRYGKLSAYDPDGDVCYFEIVKYPSSGVLVMSDKSSGEYIYRPNDGFVGKDSFSYVARDMYGNYSAAAKVSISVSRSAISAGFNDMQNERAHAQAIKLTEAGIMSGKQEGDKYLFEPEKSVSRAEFVSLAMRALGMRSVNSLRVTDFEDDADIPTEYKGYVAAAYQLEYVKGSYTDGKLCFNPGDSITRAEASVIVGRMLSTATPVSLPAISDKEDIPAWAESSVYALCSMGVLDTDNGEVRAREVMSRADTAMILSAMMDVVD